MPDLEPITREEKLWSGEDIEPITREEMYIKHIFDKTQTIPSKPLTRKEMLLEKAGEGGGSDVTIKQLSVTENGTYSEENTAYSPVIVNVPAPPIPDNAYLLNDLSGLPSDIATFTDGSALPMPSLKVSIEPIQEGSGDPSPTNVRPISGWDEVNVSVCGKNICEGVNSFLVSYSAQTGEATLIAETGTCLVAHVKEGYTYTFSNGENVNRRIVTYWDSTPNIGDSTSYAQSLTSNTFTAIKDGLVIIYIYNASVDTSVAQIELGSIATTYEPYNGQTYTIQFKDGQGNPITVYEGECDVVNGGEQPNKYVKKTLYDAWSVAGNGVFYLDGKATDGKVGAINTEADVLCSIYPKGICVGETSGAIQNPKTLCIQDLNGIRFMVYDTSFESLEDFNAYVAQNGIEIRYELETPSTFNTDPTMIKSNEGSNNVWADTGKIEELEYFSKEV